MLSGSGTTLSKPAVGDAKESGEVGDRPKK